MIIAPKKNPIKKRIMEKGSIYKTVLYSFSLRAGLKNERTWETIKGKARISPQTNPVVKAKLMN